MLGLHDRTLMPLLDTGHSRDEAETTTSDQADAVLREKPSAKFSQLFDSNEKRDKTQPDLHDSISITTNVVLRIVLLISILLAQQAIHSIIIQFNPALTLRHWSICGLRSAGTSFRNVGEHLPALSQMLCPDPSTNLAVLPHNDRQGRHE